VPEVSEAELAAVPPALPAEEAESATPTPADSELVAEEAL